MKGASMLHGHTLSISIRSMLCRFEFVQSGVGLTVPFSSVDDSPVLDKVPGCPEDEHAAAAPFPLFMPITSPRPDRFAYVLETVLRTPGVRLVLSDVMIPTKGDRGDDDVLEALLEDMVRFATFLGSSKVARIVGEMVSHEVVMRCAGLSLETLSLACSFVDLFTIRIVVKWVARIIARIGSIPHPLLDFAGKYMSVIRIEMICSKISFSDDLFMIREPGSEPHRDELSMFEGDCQHRVFVVDRNKDLVHAHMIDGEPGAFRQWVMNWFVADEQRGVHGNRITRVDNLSSALQLSYVFHRATGPSVRFSTAPHPVMFDRVEDQVGWHKPAGGGGEWSRTYSVAFRAGCFRGSGTDYFPNGVVEQGFVKQQGEEEDEEGEREGEVVGCVKLVVDGEHFHSVDNVVEEEECRTSVRLYTQGNFGTTHHRQRIVGQLLNRAKSTTLGSRLRHRIIAECKWWGHVPKEIGGWEDVVLCVGEDQSIRVVRMDGSVCILEGCTHAQIAELMTGRSTGRCRALLVNPFATHTAHTLVPVCIFPWE